MNRFEKAVFTPERVRAIHRECLARLEAEQGEDFWMLRQQQK